MDRDYFLKKKSDVINSVDMAIELVRWAQEQSRNQTQKERLWRFQYGQRLFEQGYTRIEARNSAAAAEYLPDIDPIESADDEISYK